VLAIIISYFNSLEENVGTGPALALKATTLKGPTVMTISLIPVAVAAPPAPSSAPSSSRGGPSFGDFIDHADARASDNAAARTRQATANDSRRDNNSNSPAPAANDSANQPAQS